MNEIDSCLALSLVPRLGPKTLRTLYSQTGSWQALWRANLGQWRSLAEQVPNLGVRSWHEKEEFRQDFNIVSFKTTLGSLNSKVVTVAEEEFPSFLQERLGSQTPIALYYRGTLPSQPGLAIVGTRTPTPRGQEEAVQFSMHLASLAIPIVSGLARGIDTYAHRGALRIKGQTIAVLGTPLNKIYPAENVLLADQVAGSGALISEYPPGAKITKGCFPWRNRLIAGLCRGILVVEAGTPSGALNTATWAADIGLDLFAIPGHANEPKRSGNHQLLREGAFLVEKPEEIVQMWSLHASANRPKPADLETMLTSGLSANEIAERLQIAPEIILQKRTALQLGIGYDENEDI